MIPVKITLTDERAHTEISLEVNEDELLLLRQIESEVDEAARYSFQPVFVVARLDVPHD